MELVAALTQMTRVLLTHIRNVADRAQRVLLLHVVAPGEAKGHVLPQIVFESIERVDPKIRRVDDSRLREHVVVKILPFGARQLATLVRNAPLPRKMRDRLLEVLNLFRGGAQTGHRVAHTAFARDLQVRHHESISPGADEDFGDHSVDAVLITGTLVIHQSARETACSVGKRETVANPVFTVRGSVVSDRSYGALAPFRNVLQIHASVQPLQPREHSFHSLFRNRHERRKNKTHLL